MKFEDALNRTYDNIKENKPEALKNGFLSPDGLNTAAAIWNMIALALSEKGLDDFVIINNNNIVFIPLLLKETESDENIEKSKKGTGKSPKSETATNKKVDVKEKEQPEPDTDTE